MSAAAACAISTWEAIEAVQAAARDRGDKEAIIVKGSYREAAKTARRVRELVFRGVLAIKARQPSRSIARG